MEKINLVKISVEQLRTLSECGGFYTSFRGKKKPMKLITSFNLRERRAPRPFHGENKQSLRSGRLYIWLRDNGSIALYLVQKFKPSKLQEIHGIHPKVIVLQSRISPSEQKNVLEQIANILDPQKQ